MVHLHQNLFRDDAVRNEPVPITGGMTVTRVAINGQTASEAPRGQAWTRGAALYGTFATTMRVQPPQPIAPGDSATLEMAWSFTVPPDGAPRGGQDGQVWFVSYWYPQLAVYDDVNGWRADVYMGNSEFYMGYADYDVALTVPEGWLIASTGELVNGARPDGGYGLYLPSPCTTDVCTLTLFANTCSPASYTYDSGCDTVMRSDNLDANVSITGITPAGNLTIIFVPPTATVYRNGTSGGDATITLSHRLEIGRTKTISLDGISGQINVN